MSPVGSGAIPCAIPRFIAVGMGSAEVIMVVVYTLRDDEIRLISARCATRREVTDYEG
ncbi:BrnT family toxin [Acidiferrobacter sp.]|uniref:BrnT family toxin n=1 Tax=Acidiferrobacter sp. TaxID=1872107 RepID=UPI0034195E0A